MEIKMDRYLTVGQFADLFQKTLDGAGEGSGRSDPDIPQAPEELIRRRTAAGIIHRALRRAGEADEEHTGAALRLRDLYVCRTCVNHIA